MEGRSLICEFLLFFRCLFLLLLSCLFRMITTTPNLLSSSLLPARNGTARGGAYHSNYFICPHTDDCSLYPTSVIPLPFYLTLLVEVYSRIFHLSLTMIEALNGVIPWRCWSFLVHTFHMR